MGFDRSADVGGGGFGEVDGEFDACLFFSREDGFVLSWLWCDAGGDGSGGGTLGGGAGK